MGVTPQSLTLIPLAGMPEFAPGDSLAHEIVTATAAAEVELRNGDILAVTSKVVSKVEDRFAPAAERAAAVAAESVRVVARVPGTGEPVVVENRLGIVAAAAGVDASNVTGDRILLLPEDPDASAARLTEEIAERLGVRVGVVITDTVGRPWRIGQTDITIGCAGLAPFDDTRGGTDTDGKPLSVTQRCIADEIAAAADLVKGKVSAVPVAIVRGLAHYVLPGSSHTAREILRDAESDLFRLATADAYEQGFADGARSR